MLVESNLKITNPYPAYHALRMKTPVYQDEHGTWHFTRYHDVKLLLADRRFFRQPNNKYSYLNQHKTEATVLEKIMSKWAFFNDPPYHTKLRKHLGHLFHPAFIKDTRTRIESITDELLENLLCDSTSDFMQTFAYPLPVKVLNSLLGTSLDAQTVRSWTLPIASALDHGCSEDLQQVTPIIVEVQEYFKNLLAMYKNKKCEFYENTWIGQLLNFNTESALTDEEFIATCIFLLIAGHETVQLTLGLGLKSLLKNSEQVKLLQENPKLVFSAVEEMLRFETPVNKLSRWTHDEVVIDDGTLIPQNQLVVGLINAANRDPSVFSDPDKFDITRQHNPHLAFGLGIHGCLGSFLARMELQIAFAKLIPILHRLSLANEESETWLLITSFRYLFKLMIVID